LAAPRAGAQRALGLPVVGASLDGAATMKEAPIAAQWARATAQVTAVALDPDAKRLVRDTMASGFRYPIELFAMEKVLRFPVLAHWSFTTSEGATFETLMEDLDVGLLGTVAQPKPGAVPASGPGPEVVETGHIGLGHRSRRGDAVRAWYRGPFVPFPTKRDAPVGGTLSIAHSADQIRRVVPDGREDLSLAAAFEIGRLLGLSQLSVVSALLRFRGEQFGAGRVREILARISPFAIPALVDARIDFGRFVAMQTIDQFVKNPEDMIGPRRPVADPGRELIVRGDLDEVIAGGLGIDLVAVRKLGDQVGVLAALARTQVPIARPDGNVEVDKSATAALRGALASELASVLAVAAPPQVFRSGARAKRGAARAPLPDALDALLERAARQAAVDSEDL